MNRGILKDESELSGIDKEVNAYLSSYGKMYAVFGERMREEVIQGAAEEIIYYGTIYGDSKRMFQKKIRSVYLQWNSYGKSGKENRGLQI